MITVTKSVTEDDVRELVTSPGKSFPPITELETTHATYRHVATLPSPPP